MTIEGKVISGLGVAKNWINKIKDIFFYKENKRLFPGTLNIELDYEFTFKPDIIIKKEEYGGQYDVHIKRCKVLGETAYIVRSGKNLKQDGDYKLNIVEIMAETNFRDKYNVKDGELIRIDVEK